MSYDKDKYTAYRKRKIEEDPNYLSVRAKRSKTYWETNKDKLNESNRQKRKVKILEDSKFRKKVNILAKKYHENRKETDTQYIVKRRLRSRLRTALNMFNRGEKYGSVISLIGCTIEEFIKHIENQFVEGMSWNSSIMHLDHIKPCSSFDLSDIEQQKECFHYTNYQPLFVLDNLSKSDKCDWLKITMENE